MSVAEFFMPCPFCREPRANHILLGESISLPNDRKDFMVYHPETERLQFAKCFKCKNISTVQLTTGGHPQSSTAFSNIRQARRVQEGLAVYNTIIRCVGMWPDTALDVEFAPAPVANAFYGGVTNFGIEQYDLAAVAFRRAVEISIKLTFPEQQQRQLHHSIKKLEADGKVSESLCNAMMEIKEFGNDGAHDFDKTDATTAEAIMEITNLFLIYVYKIPKRVEEINAAREQR